MLALALALFFAGSIVLGQLPSPQLNFLSPAGARPGNTVEVTVGGTDLEGAVLRFSHSGFSIKPGDKDPNKQRVVVAANIPPGLYEVRAVGTYGSSNPRLFQVGTLPEVMADEKNTTRETARELAWPCVVNGSTAAQNVQWFKLPVKKDQTLALHCWADELDSKLVPVLGVHDLDGRQFAQELRSGRLVWKPATDGAVLVRLGDFLAKGGGEYFYRLEINHVLPWQKPPPLLWAVPAATVAEVEPNDAARPQNVTLPCEIMGLFGRKRDVDAFVFDARKGEVWWLEVTSQRLGLPTDPRLVVQRAGDGKDAWQDVLELNDGPAMPGAPDFDASHLDPVGRFEAKEDGRYRLLLRDLNDIGTSAAARRYQLCVRRESPDFTLIAVAVPPTKDNTAGKEFNGPNITVCGSTVRPGQTLPIRVLVLRRDGFQGDVKLRATRLPPGVTSATSIVGGDAQESLVFVTAAADTAAWTGGVSVTGTAVIGGREVTRTARGATTLWNLNNDFVEPARSRLTQELVLSVVKDLVFPVVIMPVESLTCAANGKDKVKVPVTVQRSGEVLEATKLKPFGIPGLEKLPELEIPLGTATAEYELDVPALKLKPGSYTMWFRGTVKAKLPIKVEAKEVSPNVWSTPVVLRVE